MMVIPEEGGPLIPNDGCSYKRHRRRRREGQAATEAERRCCSCQQSETWVPEVGTSAGNRIIKLNLLTDKDHFYLNQ